MAQELIGDTYTIREDSVLTANKRTVYINLDDVKEVYVIKGKKKYTLDEYIMKVVDEQTKRKLETDALEQECFQEYWNKKVKEKMISRMFQT